VKKGKKTFIQRVDVQNYFSRIETVSRITLKII
jgi:hypothetical protein